MNTTIKVETVSENNPKGQRNNWETDTSEPFETAEEAEEFARDLFETE